ncbi:two-component regulator propeller domain-containing protein [Anaerolineales bacterium HSG24]|nr:two-component regulator propeller domain-containing protein [Anaerolineales bacterium HSG24]
MIKTALKLFISLIIFVSFVTTTQAQEGTIAETLKFDHVSVDDGLSTNVTYFAMQDNSGFMWFGTADGLNKYDGYEFTVYRQDPEEPTTISNNRVNYILQDQSGTLWAGTAGGFNRFDRETERFTRYTHEADNPKSLSHNFVNVIYEDQTDNLWVGTSAGLDLFDRETETFTHYHAGDIEADKHQAVTAIYQDQAGTLWIGTDVGLKKFAIESETFTPYRHDENDPTSISHDTVNVIYENVSGQLWIGTVGGLNRFNRETDTFTRYQADETDPYSLSDNMVTTITEDATQQLWIGTSGGGVNIFDSSTETFTPYLPDPNNPYSLSEVAVNSIYEDHTGTLWITTLASGLNRLDPQAEKFAHYSYNENNPLSLSDDKIRIIHEDHAGLLWIGTVGGGLNSFDYETKTFTHYMHDETDPHSLSHNTVVSAYEDSQGRLWVGTWGGGLNRFDRETGQFIRYLPDETDVESISNKIIAYIYEDSTGALWLGMWGTGMDKFNPQTEQIVHYLPDEQNPNSISHGRVIYIYEDSLGALWFATYGGGLNKFDRETETFTLYQHDDDQLDSIIDDLIRVIYEDSHGTLWIGTNGGLDKFDRETETFTHYRTPNGLPNNVIYGILEDEAGNLWLSTNNGLSKFNPQEETFRNYDVRDGLQGDAFANWAHYKSKRGELFFGGNNGLNAFFPDQVTDNPHAPPVVLTDFSLFNLPVGIGDDDSPLQKHVNQTDDMSLTYEQSVFSFEFSALNYTVPEKNQYAYKMEGFDKDWTYVDSSRRFATYTNLDAGTYNFRVKGSNNDDVWNEEGASIKITITPPWWETLWFRGTMLLLVVGLVSGGVYWRTHAIQVQNLMLEAQVAERTKELQEAKEVAEVAQGEAEIAREKAEIAQDKAEVANQAKSSFLANMNHELRTPLNAIIGFSQVMIRTQTLSSENLENIGIVNRSAEHLLTLINQVLNLSKIEAGRETLNKKNFDLQLLLNDLEDMFNLKADDKRLQLSFECGDEVPRHIRTDEIKLRQVIINLLNNALKFTEEGGVTVSVYEISGQEAGQTTSSNKQPTIGFSVADTGAGIAPEDMVDLFTAFTQTEVGRHAQEGTGLGLPISRKFVQLMGGDITVTSDLGQGTVFSFAIQVETITESEIQLSKRVNKKHIIALEPGQPTYRILIVDDRWANRQLLIKLLSPYGFELRDAENGQQALDIWQEWNPHLIWLDMRMPVMDGYEAAKRIKETIKGQATAVIALTASTLEEERSVVLSAGCDDFMRKPFREADIFEMMHKHIGVQYVYEEPAQAIIQSTTEVLTVSELPDEWLASFQQAVITADMDVMLELIDGLDDQHNALADALTDLVNNFEYEKLRDLVEGKTEL